MNPRISHDTSHYAECSTLMMKYQQNHIRRVVVLAVLLLANFYLHALTFGTKYAGESIQSAIYANDGKAVSLGGGLFTLLFTAVAFVIGVILFKKVENNKIRFGYVIGVLAVMGIITIGNNAASARNMQGAGVGVSHLAFGMGVFTLLLSLVALAVAFFAEQTRPKLLVLLLILLLFGTVTDCFGLLSAIPAIAVYLLAIPEYRKMAWIVKQPGYPYFNERFEEAKEHSDYEPLHKLDHRSYAEMADVNAAPSEEVFADKEKAHREEQRRIREGEMDYTLKYSDNPAEMPGIEDIFERAEPLPEPEVPDAADIPDPVWNTPDPSPAVPDTKWDMPETNWDIPDVNADIPDLPEIPDIPQI